MVIITIRIIEIIFIGVRYTETVLINQIEKPLRMREKVLIGSIYSIFVLLIIYFGMTLYFMNHFYFGSYINGINVSGESVERVNNQMLSELQAYTLNLKERDDKNEQIKAEEVGLKYNSNEEFKSFKDKQNPYKWVSELFNAQAYKMTEGYKFDDELLKERIEKLSCFEDSNIIEPKNPSFKYVDNRYTVVEGTAGNKVDKNILYKNITSAILNNKTIVDLEAAESYIKPQYTEASQKILETRNILSKYVSSKITYVFGNHKESVDGSIINNWIKIDDNFNVAIDEEKVKEYIDTLSKNYNTVGHTRNFITTSGKTIDIAGGDYGWYIDTAKETKALIAVVKEGQSIEKQPAYAQTGLAYGNNGVGNTYVEIDMSKQYLWFYKNGVLVTQGNVVTGNVSANNTTPAGVYKLKYKQRNAVLRGPDYEAPVTFWMPFNKGIGIHDASWRNVFGGNIYKTNGSHGCVNSPYNVAKAVFDNIEVGTPIVCYY